MIGVSGAVAGEGTKGTHEDDLEEPPTGMIHFGEFRQKRKGDCLSAA